MLNIIKIIKILFNILMNISNQQLFNIVAFVGCIGPKGFITRRELFWLLSIIFLVRMLGLEEKCGINCSEWRALLYENDDRD